MNSASAALTNNADRIFVAKRPPGAKTTFFSLAWVPGDVDMAIRAYSSWMEVLIRHDWALCFANMAPETILVKQESKRSESVASEGLDLVAAAAAIIQDQEEDIKLAMPPSMSAEERAERARQFRNLEHIYDKRLMIQPAVCDRDHAERMRLSLSPPVTKKDANGRSKKRGRRSVDESASPHVTRSRKSQSLDASTIIVSESVTTNPETDALETNGHEAEPEHIKTEPVGVQVKQEPTDVHDTLPKRWEDVVMVQPSSIPNAGRGLFAKRDIPGWCPIGFYFGVPIPEDEFDNYKERIGLASRYAIMYRRTVLDATDADGNTWDAIDGPIYCPFHFMNEDPARGNVAFVEGSSVNQVICMTTRYVYKGEELFAYYGTEIDRDHYDAHDDLEHALSLPGDEELTTHAMDLHHLDPPFKQKPLVRISDLLHSAAMSEDGTDGMDEEELSTMGAFVNFVWDGKPLE
jgi:hypothetical protein